MPNFTYFNTLFLSVYLQVINKVKFIHQGEGHIKVKVKYLHSFKFYVAHTFFKRVVYIRLNAFLLTYKVCYFYTSTNSQLTEQQQCIFDYPYFCHTRLSIEKNVIDRR